MKPSTKRSLSLLLAAALLIGSVVIFSTSIKKEYNNIQQLRASIIAKRQLFEEQSAIIRKVKDLLTQFQSAAQLQQTISLALPPDEAMPELFQQIFAITQSTAMKINSFGLTTEAIKPGGLGSLQINLGLQGKYEDIKAFLQTIETNIRIMDVLSLGLQKENYSISLRTYYQR